MMSKYDTDTLKIADNEVLSVKFANQLKTKLDMNQFITMDYSLAENPGMVKKVRTYTGTGDVEDLAMGAKNSVVIGAQWVETPYEVKTTHTIYTTDTYGVTFGHDISYVITDNSYIVLFRSGTNFDNVVRVNYSVSLDDEFNPGVIVSGSDIIGDEHKFEFNDESGYGKKY